MRRDAIIQNTSKALLVLGLGAFFIQNEVGAAMIVIGAGLYVFRPY